MSCPPPICFGWLQDSRCQGGAVKDLRITYERMRRRLARPQMPRAVGAHCLSLAAFARTCSELRQEDRRRVHAALLRKAHECFCPLP
jgi:hypothetical protein